MNREKVIEWAIANVTEFPENCFNCINIPFHYWEWFTIGCGMVIIHVQTGDVITKDDFYNARYNQRLTPCGMSFSELIEDLEK